MKRLFLLLTALASLGQLHAQSAQPAAPAKVAQVITINIVQQLKDPIAQLQAIKTANEAALEKQAKTLKALEDLQKQAEELKVFGKRS